MNIKQTYINTLLGLLLVIVSSNTIAQDLELYKEKFFIQNSDTLKYRIMYPKDFSEDKNYPLVLFLHGAGERGSDNTSQLIHGSNFFANDENMETFPAIVIFPQCSKDDYWVNATVDRTTMPITLTFSNGGEPTKALYLVMQLLDGMIAKSFVNQNQIYVGGLSMGGMGTYEILSRKPDMFAAAFAICGGGNLEAAEKYATKTELWIFHGANDDVVNPQLSIDMVSTVLSYGGKPNFTLYGKDNHNSWDSTFAEPQLLPWLFSKSKSN